MGNKQSQNGKVKQVTTAQRAAPGQSRGGNQLLTATQKMQHTVNNLNKRRDLLEKRSVMELKKAAHYKKQGRKKQALMALKRKKIYDQELVRIDGLSFKLEEQQINLQGHSVTADAVEAMKTGYAAQKTAMKQLDPDKVDELVQDIQEMQEIGNEAAEVLGEDMAGLEDDADLLDELENLLGEAEPQKVAAVPQAQPAAQIDLPDIDIVQLPSAPKKKPVTEDEAAFKQLEAEML
eukprot:snap_masked-scaffold_6-processed-gene-14.4-mRNA-1 protein AED:0.81 eAED:0.81 QI:0/-1/0/1/-1/1/1/0/234